ncbi:hypothetical protein LVJ94_38815 [Pendulispora rubella]|uniref:Uncharacterized protein n=1 Tax=Pendulispora rubella TaxID=2741070 RepID=A0ABZ2L2K5_9BACT
MIQWPPEHRLNDGARHALAHFRQTAAARELAEDDHFWKLEGSSWTDEFPYSLLWQDERFHELRVTCEADGLWWFDRGQVAL